MNYGLKKTTPSRILCVILCVFMLLDVFFTAVNAEWIEDGQKCDLCEEWDEDSEICDDCGCHYNDVCCEWTHCPDCGECLMEAGDFCDECGRCPDCQNICAFHCATCEEHIDDGVCDECWNCIDCAIEQGFHCSLCGECMAGSVDACPTHGDNGSESHCVNCGLICACCGECFTDDPDWYNEDLNMCLDCAQDYNLVCIECLEYSSEICEVCGLCPICAEDYGYHCPECGECTMLDWPCPDGGDHCIFCCEDNGWLCPQCGSCAESCGVDICPNCGLCELCCKENAEAEGCTCGDVCKESSDWSEHFCSECGECFDNTDRCDDCGLCAECCASVSMDEGCSTGEICVESSDWNDHFCDECGECFCEKDYCDICGKCSDCCGELSECSEGMCAEDSDYDSHFCSVCERCFHEVDQCGECEKNGEHICLECCEEASHTSKIADTSKPIMLRQPEDYIGDCSTTDTPLTASFTVKLRNPGGATYKWQVRKAGGSWKDVENSNSSSITVNVDKEACLESNLYEYRCVITNTNGSTTSEAAGVYGRHRYANAYTANSAGGTHGHACIYCGSFESSSLEEHKFGIWETVTEATASSNGSAVRTCSICGQKETKTLPKVHSHKWSTTWGHTYDNTSEYYGFHFHVCLISGCGAKTDFERHTFGDLVITSYPTESKNGEGYRVCTVCGHEETETINKLGHTHDYLEEDYDASEYQKSVYQELGTYNEFYHWQICRKKISGKTCGYVHNKALHKYENWYYADSNSTTLVRHCTVCGYEQTYTPTAEEKKMYLISVKGGTVTVDGKPVTFVKAGETVTVKFLGNDYFSDGYRFKTWDPAYLTGITLITGSLTSTEISFKMPAYTLKFSALSQKCTHYIGKTKYTAQDPTTAIEASCFTNGKSADVVCKICGEVVKEGSVINCYGCHDYKTDESTVKASTCTSCGYTGNKVCTRCGAIEKGEKTSKLQHTYGITTVVTAATCHSLGRYGQKCDSCGILKLGDTISRLSHTPSEAWTSDSVGHWKLCSDKDCDAIAVKKSAHSDENGDFVCDVCGYSTRGEGQFRITFDPNGGACDTDSAQTTDGKLKKLPAALRGDNFVFMGWFTKAEGGDEITSDYVFDSDATLYAQFRLLRFGIRTKCKGKGNISSDCEEAEVGSTVTVTLTPEDGYSLSEAPSVTDGDGSSVEVTKVSDFVYTFIMLKGDVEISASFVENAVTSSITSDTQETSDAVTESSDTQEASNAVTESSDTQETSDVITESSDTQEASDVITESSETEEGEISECISILIPVILIILALLLIIGIILFVILKKRKEKTE